MKDLTCRKKFLLIPLDVIQIERFLSELFDKHFSQGTKSKSLFLNLSKERQISEVKNILLNNGYSYDKGGEGFDVDEAFINRYVVKK